MTEELANALTDYIPDSDVYENYSGRGMFGETTTGIVCNKSEFYNGIGGFLETAEEFDIELINEVGTMFKNLRTDSMGLSMIFY